MIQGGGIQAVELVFLALLLFVVMFALLARKLRTPYPIVLVRLTRVTREALKDLLRGAHRVVSSKPPVRRRATKRRR